MLTPSSQPEYEKTFTVSELNNTVRELVRSAFPAPIWVCGEIQDLRQRLHINFNLVQDDPEKNEVAAQVSAVIFANAKNTIFRRLREAGSAFELKDDIEVRLLCKVDLYAKTGKFSLTVIDIDPVYTLGKLAQNRQKIIDELQRTGVLEKNKQKSIPLFPLRIGLITAHDSAAYHDFMNELKMSGYGFVVFLHDSLMQGRNVERGIVGAFRVLNRFKEDELDAVVVTRGGGSTADLSWFDNKKIAETIARSRFPVITALGHQINVTIADLVAHTSVKTPTKAAQFFIARMDEIKSKIEQLQADIINRTGMLLDRSSQNLETKALRVESLVHGYFRSRREALVQKNSFLLTTVVQLLRAARKNIDSRARLFEDTLKKAFQAVSGRIQYIEDKVRLLDPRKILQRGYSISLKNGRAVKTARSLLPGDEMITVFFDGQAHSRVSRTEQDRKNKDKEQV